MSNDSKQQSENDLKIIDKIKVKIKPDTFENNKTKMHRFNMFTRF